MFWGEAEPRVGEAETFLGWGGAGLRASSLALSQREVLLPSSHYPSCCSSPGSPWWLVSAGAEEERQVAAEQSCL